MNGLCGATPLDLAQPLQLLNCPHGDCGATFTRQWKLKEHETVHTGAKPFQCVAVGCSRNFSRKFHLRRHVLIHTGVKHFKCRFASCDQAFFNARKLKRHEGYAHGNKDSFFKCNQPNCSMTFKKRRRFKLHAQEHGVPSKFKCLKDGCGATFDSRSACKAHMKKHAGYRCPRADCQVVENTWGKLCKHMAKHPATYKCDVCKKVFKKREALRRHKRTHASHRPVLACPRDDCQAYFSTTFNLQHHIRKVHLNLLKYKCCFPDCPRMFAMRESMIRHTLRHDPSGTTMMQKRNRPKKSWQRRLTGNTRPLVEDNLSRLFTLRLRLSRRAKVEANLAGLFSERKIPHYVDPEVNLRSLFSIKPPHALFAPEVAPVKG